MALMDLFRPKWDEQRGAVTYGAATISKATETVTEYNTGHTNGHHPTSQESTQEPERPWEPIGELPSERPSVLPAWVVGWNGNMGTGTAEGEHRAMEAAQRAISSPLLEDASIHGARGVLINVSGGEDMTLHEVGEAAAIVQEAADPDANIIFGTVVDRSAKSGVKVTVIATGFPRDEMRHSLPQEADVFEQPLATAPLQQTFSASEPVPAQAPLAPRPSRRTEAFARHDATNPPELDANDEGFTPNFSKMKDDLDVPAFLRKQMD